jgi:hypothetical protein
MQSNQSCNFKSLRVKLIFVVTRLIEAEIRYYLYTSQMSIIAIILHKSYNLYKYDSDKMLFYSKWELPVNFGLINTNSVVRRVIALCCNV